MEIVDLFMEKSKDKFLNMLVKIPKAYDWYLGIVIKLDDYDLARLEPIDDFLTRRCEEIYDKSEKHLQLLKILLIDDYTLLLFGTDPIPYVKCDSGNFNSPLKIAKSNNMLQLKYNSNIKGVLKSVCKYLDCKIYEANYIKYLRDMVFDPWGEQNYHYIISDNKAYDLRAIKED